MVLAPEVQQLLDNGRAARAALSRHRTSPITVALGTWFYDTHMHAYSFGVASASKNSNACGSPRSDSQTTVATGLELYKLFC